MGGYPAKVDARFQALLFSLVSLLMLTGRDNVNASVRNSQYIFLRLCKHFIFIKICRMEHLLTTEEAAARLGVTPARVRQMILSGQLPARKFAKVHMIDARDLELIKDRPKAGRPPKAKTETGSKASKKKSIERARAKGRR